MNDVIKRITVLMGGWSPEREVSIKSGEYVSEILEKMGYEVYRLYVEKDLRRITEELYKSNPDFIFNLLHGIGGEDGVIQGVLEIFGKSYSNSGVLSSAICFNKSICKKIARLNGISIAKGFDINRNEIKKLGTEIAIEYPFVVKPAENGSSVGVFLIFNEIDLEKLKKSEWTFGEEVMVEEYIKGREFTVLLINGKAIGTVEVTHKNKFYDYASKYEVGGSAHISDFELDQKPLQDMAEMSERIFAACKCKGVARTDFRYDGEKAYFMEINTQTGMTELSLAPDIARFNGMSIEELLKAHFEKS